MRYSSACSCFPHGGVMIGQQLALFDQRWLGRREYRLPPGAGGSMKLTEWGIEVFAGDKEPYDFICAHHYSASYPAAQFRVGLMRKTGVEPARTVGVAVFSTGINNKAIPSYTGLDQAEGIELGRFLLLDECPHNSESWFLDKALGVLKAEKPKIRTVLSYSDPVERRMTDGTVVKPGHFGTIYAARSATYVGRSSKRTLYLTRFGTVVSDRGLSKIRNQTQGHAYAYRQMLDAGAPERETGESWPDWVRRALDCGAFTKVRHPGNHAFLFGLDMKAKAVLRKRYPAPLPYPKKDAT